MTNNLQFSTFMAMRIGTGLIKRVPELEYQKVEILEHIEPLTGVAFNRFLRTHSVIANAPISLNLLDRHTWIFESTNPNWITSTLWAGIAGICYRHSPKTLNICAITSRPEEWDWLKWLPHGQHARLLDQTGRARHIYPSVAEFLKANEPELNDRGVYGTEPARGGYYLVLVDAQGKEPQFPSIYPLKRGAAGVTFILLDPASNYIGVHEGNRIRFNETTALLPTGAQVLRDQYTRYDIELFSRSLAPYVPPNYFGQVVAEKKEEKIVQQTLQEYLNLTDISLYDPTVKWRENENTISLAAPVGYKANAKFEATVERMVLDIAEKSRHGTGPHGVLSGRTGEGKSFLFKSFVLMLQYLYSPETMVFLLMDFKGGSTFTYLKDSFHCLAAINDLESLRDLVIRSQDVIAGELNTRKELLDRYAAYGTKDIVAYRSARLAHPELEMPPLPYLVIIIDEFQNFIQKPENSAFKIILNDIAMQGRSLGMFMLLGTQVMTPQLAGETVWKNCNYMISLPVESAQDSRHMFDSDIATRLPKFCAAIKYFNPQGEKLVETFRCWDIEARYIPKKVNTITNTREGTNSVSNPVVIFEAQNKGALTLPGEAREETQTEIVSVNKLGEDVNIDRSEIPVEERMENVLLSKIVPASRNYQRRELWLRPLREPSTLGEFLPELIDNNNGLYIRIGCWDDPYHATLPEMFFTIEGGTPHTVICGGPESGKSTYLQTVITSSLITYQQFWVNFAIIDYTRGLSGIRDLPNVAAYARNSEDTLIRRIIAEVAFVIKVREAEFRIRDCDTVYDYLMSKMSEKYGPVGDDPYGYLFLVIDGWEVGKEELENVYHQELISILDLGGKYGVHLISTFTGGNTMNYKYQSRFQNFVQFRANEFTVPTVDPDIKQSVKELATREPGITIDLHSGHFGRTYVPVPEALPPTSFKDGMPRFNYQKGDILEKSRAWWGELTTQHEEENGYCPQIVPVSEMIDYNYLIERFLASQMGDWRQQKIAFPIGLNTGTTLPVNIVDRTYVGDTPQTVGDNHFLTVGSGLSGRTTMIRNHINWVTSQYSPDEVVIFIAEIGRFDLLDLSYQLRKTGYLGDYVSETGDMPEFMATLRGLMEPRMPASTKEFSQKDLIEHTWWSGKTVFLYADGVLSLSEVSFMEKKPPQEDEEIPAVVAPKIVEEPTEPAVTHTPFKGVSLSKLRERAKTGGDKKTETETTANAPVPAPAVRKPLERKPPAPTAYGGKTPTFSVGEIISKYVQRARAIDFHFIATELDRVYDLKLGSHIVLRELVNSPTLFFSTSTKITLVQSNQAENLPAIRSGPVREKGRGWLLNRGLSAVTPVQSGYTPPFIVE